MAQTTLRFEFTDSGAPPSGESTSQPTAPGTAGNAAAGRAGKAKGFDLLRSLDELTGGFIARMEKAIEGFRKNFRTFQDIWERARQFFERSNKQGSFTKAAAKFIPSEVVKASTNAAKEAVSQAAQAAASRGPQAASSAGAAASRGGGLILEGKVLSRTVLPAGGRAIAAGASTAASGATTAGSAAGAAGSAASVGSLAGPIGAAVAVGIVAGTAALVYGVKKLAEVNAELKKRFEEMASRARDYSPALQIEEVKNSIAEMRQNLRVAQRDGEKLASFNAAQNKMNQSLQRLSDTINSLIGEVAIPLVEGIADKVSTLATVGEGMAESQRTGLSFLGGILSGITGLGRAENKKAEKLPPEGDIIGIFRSAPPLPVHWGGRVWTPNKGGEVFDKSTASYEEPLPMRGMP